MQLARAISRPGNIVKFWGCVSVPIHIFFSFAAERDFGRSRLSHVVADSDAVAVANAADTDDVVPDALTVLAESVNFALGGIAPSLMEAVGMEERLGRGGGCEWKRERERREVLGLSIQWLMQI